MNRKIKIFHGDGSTFSARYEAEKWLTENGYSYGSSCAMFPTGIVKGENIYIAKWRNMSKKERNALDGELHANREGDAKIIFR